MSAARRGAIPRGSPRSARRAGGVADVAAGESCTVLVLAAGRSTRMKSEKSKLLHLLRGKPILARTLVNAGEVGRVYCVVGDGADEMRAIAEEHGAQVIVQEPPLGTGHAVLCAEQSLRGRSGTLLILNGDVPLAGPEILSSLVAFHVARRCDLTVLSTRPPDPGRYGRIVRRGSDLEAIVEYLDASARVRAVGEINAGIYCARIPAVFPYLHKLTNKNEKREYYLTDLVAVLRRARRKVACMFMPAWRELLGINDRTDLDEAEAILNRGKIRALQREGVSVRSSCNTFIGDDVSIAPDTTVHPFSIIDGKTRIGRHCVIMPFTRVVDSTLGDRVTVLGSSLIVDSVIEGGSTVGPFCHLRGRTRILRDSKVGNFVEMKKTAFGPASKAMHLTYLGDATVGEAVNVGAGTITCNYDGVSKNPTHVERGVFIGSGTELVAPVRVGEGAYVAAGSTITEDVPAGSLGIARARQITKEGWAARRKGKS
ncbi:MAG: bifunctional UDP-N-acetylglucosamine diphosphorylase/glucosamine-1-phosphate N-acetyltransferase GlmU [Acidobacteriota bacterium]